MLDSKKTILSQEHMKKLMNLVREILDKQGNVAPTIVIQFDNGSVAQVEFNTQIWDESAAFSRQTMKELSTKASQTGRRVIAAALIGHIWSIDTDKHPDGPGMPIEEHPDRHDAVGIIARNVDNSLCSAIEQLVVTSESGKSKLGKVAREVYEQPPTRVGVSSVLDDFFIFLDKSEIH